MKTIKLTVLLLIIAITGCHKEMVEPIYKPMDSVYAITNNMTRIGRWITPNQSLWGGAYIKTQFKGNVKINFGDKVLNNYYVKIDDQKWVEVNVLTPGSFTFKAPDDQYHLLTIAQGKDYFYQFNFIDITGQLSQYTPSKDLIEYIGDSITCGYLNPYADISDYAWICSEMLNAEHTQIAYPGINLVKGMDTQYFMSACKGGSPWQFTQYKPTIIVINLGTNDQNHKVSDKDFRTTYIQFIKDIRSKYGNIPIFLMRPFNGAKANSIQETVTARHNASDMNVYYINTTGWLGKGDFEKDGLHPNPQGHIDAANRLQTILKPFIGKP